MIMSYDNRTKSYDLDVAEFAKEFVAVVNGNKQITRLSTNLAETKEPNKGVVPTKKLIAALTFIFKSCCRTPATKAIDGVKLSDIELPDFMVDLIFPCGVYLDSTDPEVFEDYRAKINVVNGSDDFDYADYRTVFSAVYGSVKKQAQYGADLFEATKPINLNSDIKHCFEGKVELDRKDKKLPVPLVSAVKKSEYYTQTINNKLTACIKLVIEGM